MSQKMELDDATSQGRGLVFLMVLEEGTKLRSVPLGFQVGLPEALNFQSSFWIKIHILAYEAWRKQYERHESSYGTGDSNQGMFAICQRKYLLKKYKNHWCMLPYKDTIKDKIIIHN